MVRDHSALSIVWGAGLVLALAALACNAPPSTPAYQPTPGASPTSWGAGSELVPLTPTLPANPLAATKVNTNVRTGPDTVYPILATLNAGLPLRLTGRNADKSWLQIEFSASPTGYAWVFAENVNLNPTVNVEALPVANAPPTPEASPAAAVTATLAP
jgi:uncharacterized protein YgiM (DUF1202 family)